jgi:hypothetical protein
VSTADLLKGLKRARAERASLDRRELAMITGARALDATRNEIAKALGLGSPTEACEHYEALAQRLAPPDLTVTAETGDRAE